jgi:hypothetical protein
MEPFTLAELADLASAAAEMDSLGRYGEADAIDVEILRVAYLSGPTGNLAPSYNFLVQKMDTNQLDDIDRLRRQHPRFKGEGNVQENDGNDDEDYKDQQDMVQVTPTAAVPRGEPLSPSKMQDTSRGNQSVFDLNANGSLPFAFEQYDPKKIKSTQDLNDRAFSKREEMRNTSDGWKLKLPQTF